MRECAFLPFFLGALGLFSGCALEVSEEEDPLEGAVGVQLRVIDGVPEPLMLVPGQRYYVQDLHFRALQFDYPAPDVVDWLAGHSDFSTLDWTGLANLPEHWEDEGLGAWGAERAWLGAAWMLDDYAFTLEVLDESGGVLGDPVVLSDDHFVMPRRSVLSWLSGAPARGDHGENTGSYDGVLEATSSGPFTGLVDDVFLVEVFAAGAIDGTAEVDISSVRGEASPGVAVTSGVPVALGQGATIQFDDLLALGTGELTEGDRWIVRCDATSGEVSQPEPGTRATFSARAELLFLVPATDTEVFEVPADASTLHLNLIERSYEFPLSLEPLPDAYGFGLAAEVAVTHPAGNSVFQPGDTVEVVVTLEDGAGNPLHSADGLPSYGEFLVGGPEYSGILYADLGAMSEPCSVFGDCRLDIMEIEVAGPKHLSRTDHGEGRPGYLADGAMLPDFGIIYGGFGDPSLWSAVVPNRASVQLPPDAEPGTYVAMLKAGRAFRGERSYVLETAEFQVGAAEHTSFPSRVACDVCHAADGAMERLRHGTGNDRLCVTCHTYEHGTAGEVVHIVHYYSPLYPVRRNDCTLCHVAEGSNSRASRAECGSCHGEIHQDEIGLDPNPYAECGSTCHVDEPAGHVAVQRL